MADIDQQNAQRLLRECRELLEHDLGEWIDEVGPVIAEELLTLANATRDDARKKEYLHLRGDLDSRWETLTAAFHEHLTEQLKRVKVVEPSPSQVPNFADLQLVDDQELTERIVAREFLGRVSEACSEESYALDRRIAHLLGREELTEGDNQFGPQVVCAAVRTGCEAMQANLDNRTLLLRQLERHLQSELPELYRAINEILIQAGILPELKRSYRRSVTAGTLAAGDSATILGTLQRLAQARQPGGSRDGLPAGNWAGAGGGGTTGGEALPPGMVAVSPAFLESLQALQAMPAADPGGLTNVVRLARDSDAARQVPPLEAITLDIVAMLFDLIFDDDRVPNAVKGLVSRLQIPVLKVAMLDQQFFADRGHPARRFLDSISGIAIRWGETVNEGDPFYIKLSQLVERIHDTFDKEADIFGTAITELAGFVTEREAMEAETSRVVAEVVQGKEDELRARLERQAVARQAADAALAPLLATALPRPIEQFLRDQWHAVLQKLALADGADSAQFRAAERIAGELAWSIAPKRDAEERRRLVALLPKLLPGLHQGLDQLGTSADARRPLLDALVDLHAAAIRAEVYAQTAAPEAEEAPAPVDAPAVVLQVTHSVENGIDIEQVSLPEDETPADGSGQDRTYLRRVKHLVRGDWIEFIDDGGQGRRERLTWISPNRSLYLFSNHATKCAISITPEALAHRLQTETARLVEREAPLFERALDGAIKALDQTA